jgi:hypothetical protein
MKGITHNLDLHGVRHYEVEELVEDFILMNQDKIPLRIVCGNSQRMIDIVNSVINRIDCKTVAMDQFGIITIREI